jgi:hypothetical protein
MMAMRALLPPHRRPLDGCSRLHLIHYQQPPFSSCLDDETSHIPRPLGTSQIIKTSDWLNNPYTSVCQTNSMCVSFVSITNVGCFI